jgi:D-beta-D-heptose 7-phosphate kinase/D-beta-D-heptose 1-phosphate adenosyltransferase
MTTLLDRLGAWGPFKAVVVGDYMLDETLYGDADRLSPDAPVPVLHVRRTERTPGGAANLALALAALGGQVRAIGVVGADEMGLELAGLLDQRGVAADDLVADSSRPTTLKRYHVGLAQHRHPHKMFRVDFESRKPVGGSIAGRLVDAVERALADADVVFIEDYAKGVCTPAVCRAVIDRARAAGVPVIVDPARVSDYSMYRGCTAITPNRTEAEQATGLEADDGGPDGSAPLASKLLSSLECEAVVLTLDRHGALLLERGGEPVCVPTVARDVYDVTGAGDVFAGALGAARANGCTWADAVRMANAAAGLEVESFGASPIPLARVHHAMLVEEARQRGKVRSPAELMVEIEARRAQGERIVFTNGCFDVIHSGHVSLLSTAKGFGDFLVVGLNSDDSVRRLKGPDRPVNDEDERSHVLGAIGAVGAIVVFDEDTPLKLLEAIRPDVLCKGADYTHDEVVGAELIESYGGRVELIDLVAGKSTTETIARLRST